MTKTTFFEIINSGKSIEFFGEVVVTTAWNGYGDFGYFAQYADRFGIHACPQDCEDEVDCYSPILFDDIDDETFAELLSDICE